MKVRGISIAVKNIDISMVFYSEILGMPLLSAREGHIVYEGLDIYSLQRWSELSAQHVMDVCFSHYTSSLDLECDNFSTILERIYKTDWVKIFAPLRSDKGLRLITLLDPDDNLVTIYESASSVKAYTEPLTEDKHKYSINSSSRYLFHEENATAK